MILNDANACPTIGQVDVLSRRYCSERDDPAITLNKITYLMALLDKRDSENISDGEKKILRTLAKAIKGE
jgi:hypothetical protein